MLLHTEEMIVDDYWWNKQSHIDKYDEGSENIDVFVTHALRQIEKNRESPLIFYQ